MYAQIAKAISSGFTSKQIIDYILKKFPNQSGKIKDALAAGYTVDQVVKYLGGGKKSLNMMPMPEETSTGVNTEFARTRQKDIQRSQQENKYAMAAGTAAIGGLGAGMATKALSRALPANLLEYGQNTLQQPRSIPPTSQPPMGPGPNSPGVQVMGGNPPSQPMPSPANIPQPPVSTQGIVPQRDIKKSVDLIKNIGEESRVKNLIEGGLAPKDIAGVLRKLVGKEKLQVLEGAEGGLESAIEDYAQSIVKQPKDLTETIPTSEEMLQQNALEPEEKKEDLNLPEETIESAKPIEKNQTVVAPQGIGEVKAIRNGKALVEIDGKTHQIDESELEQPIYSKEEIAKTYNDLMSMIPEEHKSGFIQWAGYNEDTNELGFIPRGGKYEVIKNITPEEAQKIKEGKGVARTTGETREGLWVVGEDTRGGVISQIIHDRRKKHQTSEEKQLKLGFELPKKEKEDKGMKPLFDELSYARNASKEMDQKAKEIEKEIARKKKEDEKARLKREKDEAKKRKK